MLNTCLHYTIIVFINYFKIITRINFNYLYFKTSFFYRLLNIILQNSEVK